MESIWNNACFTSPPVNTYKCFDSSLDVSRFHTILSDAQSCLENQQALHMEAAIISRLVYKMGRKFRHDIGHSYIRRCNTALLKYLNLNYVGDVKILLSVVPDDFHEAYIYAPTRQMLEYVLVRTQTFAKLLFRISLCAKSAAVFYFERLKRGDSAWLSLMPYSVLARIWFLSKRFLKNVCKWYSEILPFLNKLEIVGTPIIPNNYKFPRDLCDWIDIKELDAQSSNPWKSSEFLQQFCIDYEAEENTEKESQVESQTSMDNLTKTPKNVQKRIAVKNVEDVGTVISRDEFTKISMDHSNDKGSQKPEKPLKSESYPMKSKNKQNDISFHKKLNNNKIVSKRTDSSKHSLKSVTCVKSLSKFFKNEDILRTENYDSAVSKDIGVMRWQTFKMTICKKMLKLQKKHSVLNSDVFNNMFCDLWNKMST